MRGGVALHGEGDQVPRLRLGGLARLLLQPAQQAAGLAAHLVLDLLAQFAA